MVAIRHERPADVAAGLRERDYRNGIKELLSGSFWDKLPFLPPILARPAWLVRFWRDGGGGFDGLSPSSHAFTSKR